MKRLAFPTLSIEEKKTRLLQHNAGLKHTERVGLLGDLLIENKSNSVLFLNRAGGVKPLYPEIARMLNLFPLIFLVEFFSQPKIPMKEGADWKRYLWGATWAQYREWSAKKAEEEHLRRKMQEEPMAFIHQYVAENGRKWRKQSY